MSPHVVGPVWRDANVRTGPDLHSPIRRVLQPDDTVQHTALRWVTGDRVVEGEIVSDVWFALAEGEWCSAVNFDQRRVTEVTAS